jgi:hypothetical protein
MSWSDAFFGLLKDYDVRLISYVPQMPRDPTLIRSRFMRGSAPGEALGWSRSREQAIMVQSCNNRKTRSGRQ